MQVEFISIREILTQKKSRAVALVGSGKDLNETFVAMDRSGARHFVAADGADLEMKRQLTQRLETKPPSTAQGLAKEVLTAEYSEAAEFTFLTPEQKNEAVDRLVRIAHGVSSLAPHTEGLRTLAEELCLNALYSSVHALKEINGEVFKNQNSRPCVLSLYFDSKHGLVTAWDPVGSLQVGRVVGRLKVVFGLHPVPVERGPGGTPGLGCRLMLAHCSDLFAFSERFQHTLVGCRFPLDKDSQQTEYPPKNIHLIAKQGANYV